MKASEKRRSVATRVAPDLYQWIQQRVSENPAETTCSVIESALRMAAVADKASDRVTVRMRDQDPLADYDDKGMPDQPADQPAFATSSEQAMG